MPASSSPLGHLQPNEDLVRGDRVIITQWCKHKAYARTRIEGSLVLQDTVATKDVLDPNEATILPNQQFFGDILEVVGVDYPWAIFDVHSCRAATDYAKARYALDVRDFECRKVKQEYFTAMLSGKPEPPPAVPPVPVMHKHLINVSVFGLERELVPLVIKLTLLFGGAWAVLWWLKGGGR